MPPARPRRLGGAGKVELPNRAKDWRPERIQKYKQYGGNFQPRYGERWLNKVIDYDESGRPVVNAHLGEGMPGPMGRSFRQMQRAIQSRLGSNPFVYNDPMNPHFGTLAAQYGPGGFQMLGPADQYDFGGEGAPSPMSTPVARTVSPPSSPAPTDYSAYTPLEYSPWQGAPARGRRRPFTRRDDNWSRLRELLLNLNKRPDFEWR